jgi:hypothetical protein
MGLEVAAAEASFRCFACYGRGGHRLNVNRFLRGPGQDPDNKRESSNWTSEEVKLVCRARCVHVWLFYSFFCNSFSVTQRGARAPSHATPGSTRLRLHRLQLHRLFYTPSLALAASHHINNQPRLSFPYTLLFSTVAAPSAGVSAWIESAWPHERSRSRRYRYFGRCFHPRGRPGRMLQCARGAGCVRPLRWLDARR